MLVDAKSLHDAHRAQKAADGRRRVIVERNPYALHAYESLTLRKFHDFRIREHRILAQRRAQG